MEDHFALMYHYRSFVLVSRFHSFYVWHLLILSCLDAISNILNVISGSDYPSPLDCRVYASVLNPQTWSFSRCILASPICLFCCFGINRCWIPFPLKCESSLLSLLKIWDSFEGSLFCRCTHILLWLTFISCRIYEPETLHLNNIEINNTICKIILCSLFHLHCSLLTCQGIRVNQVHSFFPFLCHSFLRCRVVETVVLNFHCIL